MRNKGITLLEFLTIAFAVIILMLIFLPPLWKVRKIAETPSCSLNLKGLGTAFMVYANDYDNNRPQLPGEGPWSRDLGFAFDLEKPDFAGEHKKTGRTISASWYLLIREADISPRSFICPGMHLSYFDGNNENNLDLIELWDFGDNPYDHLSYVMQNPYGRYPLNGKQPAEFAAAGDQSPWFSDGEILPANTDSKLPPQLIHSKDNNSWRYGNSPNHKRYTMRKLFKEIQVNSPYGLGQNVLYGDGHVSYERSPNVGINKDNIYTYWSTEDNPTEQDIQGGTAPAKRDKQNDSKNEKDSFLVM